jgi:hypothetical protein
MLNRSEDQYLVLVADGVLLVVTPVVLGGEVESLGAVNLDGSPGVALPEDSAVGVVREEGVGVLAPLGAAIFIVRIQSNCFRCIKELMRGGNSRSDGGTESGGSEGEEGGNGGELHVD